MQNDESAESNVRGAENECAPQFKHFVIRMIGYKPQTVLSTQKLAPCFVVLKEFGHY